MGNDLTDADRETLRRAAEIEELRTADQVREWAGAKSYDVTSTLSAYVELAGATQALLGDLADIIGRLDDAEDDAPEEYRCATCKSTMSIFIGHGPDWHHYRGSGTPDDPIELYD